MNRDTFIFYRSFYESINELQPEEQLLVYTSIFEYCLNFKEPKLTGVCKTIFILIKPILDANNQRYINGSKPKTKGKDKQEESETEAKQKQDESKPEGNKDKDVDKDNNVDVEKEETHPFISWIKLNCKSVSKMTKFLTDAEAERLVNEFDKNLLVEICQAMENHKELNKRYSSTNLTIRAWINMRKSNPIKNQSTINQGRDGLLLN